MDQIINTKKNKKGQKSCPKCNHVTGPRAFNCPNCDYCYFPDKEKKTVPYVSQGLSRGKKRCFSCQAIVAARQTQCSCGYNFVSKEIVPNYIPIEKPKIEEIDWLSLSKGDKIEVLTGQGDHYKSENGITYLVTPGIYKVQQVQPTGLLVTETTGSGFSFINMTESKSKVSNMIIKEKHNIVKVS